MHVRRDVVLRALTRLSSEADKRGSLTRTKDVAVSGLLYEHFGSMQPAKSESTDMPCCLRAAAVVAMVSICAALLTACAGTPSPSILSLGSKIVPHKVDFEEIYQFAERSNAAYASKS